jgi:hypothetical protein
VTATPVGNAVLKKGSIDLAGTVQFHFLNCADAAISIGRPKFSLEPTENVRLHAIGLDGDFFNMGTFPALKYAQAAHCARR